MHPRRRPLRTPHARADAISVADAPSTYASRDAPRLGQAVEVRPEVASAFRDEMHERQRGLVWGSCESWYLNDEGYSPTNWPGTVGEYRRRTATFDPADYVVGSTTTASPVAT